MGFILARVIVALMLFWALERHPYSYYVLLRWVTCAVCAYGAFRASEISRTGWAWLLGIIALLFNPIVPAHLDRGLWNLIDLVTAGILLVSLVVLRFPVKKTDDGSTANQNHPGRWDVEEPPSSETTAAPVEKTILETHESPVRVQLSCSACGVAYTVTLMRPESQAACPKCHNVDSVFIKWI